MSDKNVFLFLDYYSQKKIENISKVEVIKSFHKFTLNWFHDELNTVLVDYMHE